MARVDDTKEYLSKKLKEYTKEELTILPEIA